MYEGDDRAVIHADRAMPDDDRRPEAREALDRVFVAAEAIHYQINGLEERLHDLLGPKRAALAEKPGDVRGTLTGYGAKVHQAADQLSAAERRLADLLDRLRDGI